MLVHRVFLKIFKILVFITGLDCTIEKNCLKFCNVILGFLSGIFLEIPSEKRIIPTNASKTSPGIYRNSFDVSFRTFSENFFKKSSRDSFAKLSKKSSRNTLRNSLMDSSKQSSNDSHGAFLREIHQESSRDCS